MPVRSSRLRAALFLAFPCLLATTAAAQKPADKDLQAISAYTFTLPKYKQLMTAMINLGKAAQQNPAMADALEMSGDQTLDQMVARYSAVPAVKKAIADAGLSPREFAVAQGAMIQAGMSYGIMKQYKLSPDSVSKSTGVSKANLEFFRANEAELERMGKEMEAQMPKEEASGEANTAEQPDSEEPDSAE
jgi:hypothetical protein